MTKGTPPVGGATNGANGGSVNPNPNPNHNHYSANRSISQQMLVDISQIVYANLLPNPDSFMLTSSLAGALLNSGYAEADIGELIKAIASVSNGQIDSDTSPVSNAANRIKKGQRLWGWPTVVGILGQVAVTEIQDKLRQGNPSNGDFVILDSPPDVMRKPLSIIRGRAYAATWTHVKQTLHETKDENGVITKHKPPLVKEEKRLLIVREDGLIFNDDKHSLADLGFAVELNEIPSMDKLWSPEGLKRYRGGERPDAKSVFERIRDVNDTFIDFDKSFGSQQEICELIACYTIASWFLEAFNVIGFLMATGEKGSGKTQLLVLVCKMSYLGEFITDGSFASLRDLADYSAMLGFDEAENLGSSKFDQAKRSLLLAGNRRGSKITLKVSVGNNKWQNREVNTFCPRMFAAINLPDATLASRTIMVTLVRSSNKSKANTDPEDLKKWPHDYRRLVDDCWALALSNVVELEDYERYVNENASLMGRNLEPWKAILAVAKWLDDKGVSGLWDRMHALSVKYQDARQELESEDINTLIVRALCGCEGCEVSELSVGVQSSAASFHTRMWYKKNLVRFALPLLIQLGYAVIT
jgi:hypothetical protein